MELAEHLRLLAAEATQLADAAARAGLATPVPTCPGWSVRDLVAHTDGVYRWAARVLRGEQRGFATAEQLAVPAGSDDDLLARYRADAAELGSVLRSAPVGPVWTFWPVDEPVRFWARRMANETAIHRVDVQRAAGAVAVAPIDAAQAADGIAELLTGLLALRPVGVRVERPVRLAVQPDDREAWVVTLSAERIAAVAGRGEADASVAGPASDVYAWLWNRGGDVVLDGDPAVTELWQKVRVRLG